MSPEQIRQLTLLRCAVGNVIDNAKDVLHITYPEILEWIDDILSIDP